MKSTKSISQKLVDQFAQIFPLTPDEARAYLFNVQSLFILNKPPFRIILDAVRAEKFKSLPTPLELAEVIRKIWTKNPSRLSKFKDETISPLSNPEKSRRDRFDLILETSSPKYEPEEKERNRPILISHTVNDKQRVMPNRLPHCLHGVPISKICAICEPEKFRENVETD
jgi:hypothetical protein